MSSRINLQGVLEVRWGVMVYARLNSLDLAALRRPGEDLEATLVHPD